MGLSICAFVPEGIVIASDSLAEIRHQDDGFYQDGIQRLYNVENRFLVAIEGPCFHQGLPVSFFLTPLFKKGFPVDTVEEFSQKLIPEIERILPGEPYVIYVAGYENRGQKQTPVVTLIHDKKVVIINQDPSGNPVYNFHAIGRTHWVNKVLMNTQAESGEDHIQFQEYDIDFSKYSLSTAKEFSLFLLSMSERMDKFSQLKPMIGGKYQVGMVRPYESVSITL